MNRQVRPADFATPVSPWRALIQRAGAGLVTLGVILVALIVGFALWNSPLIQDAVEDEAGAGGPAGAQDTLLWVRTNFTTGEAEGLTLFGKSEDKGIQVLFIPVSLYSLLPGIGTDELGFASRYGGTDLMVASVENLMGIHIDSVVSASSEDMGAWIQAAGGLNVSVPDTVTSKGGEDGARKVIQAGEQFMTGPEVISYITLERSGETEIDTFTRSEVVWKTLSKVLAKEDVAAKVLSDPPPHLQVSRDGALVRPLLTALDEGPTAYSVLPVKPVGTRTGEDTHYSPDWKAIRRLVETTWAGSLPEGSTGAPKPIQILNGVGEPGVGQKVDARLAGLNLRVVVSENADTFQRELTEVVVYSDDPETRKLGEAVVAQLGVGRLVKSNQPQSVVEVSIVVGADFLAKEAERAAAAATSAPPAPPTPGTPAPPATPAPGTPVAPAPTPAPSA